MTGLCEVSWDALCTGRAQHTHHRVLRSQGGDNSPANLIAVCLNCHTQIHANPGESYCRGYLVHQWDDPATITYRRRLEVA